MCGGGGQVGQIHNLEGAFYVSNHSFVHLFDLIWDQEGC